MGDKVGKEMSSGRRSMPICENKNSGEERDMRFLLETNVNRWGHMEEASEVHQRQRMNYRLSHFRNQAEMRGRYKGGRAECSLPMYPL